MGTKPRLNVNVGILGHIDSGKTSLARAISTAFSTASLDKAPQSASRGITLDLGFSSFLADFPDDVDEETRATYDGAQFTLVDCPGHASLIKTVLGGASIIDMMILVVDANKGVQTQAGGVFGRRRDHDGSIARRAEQSGHVRGEDARGKGGEDSGEIGERVQ